MDKNSIELLLNIKKACDQLSDSILEFINDDTFYEEMDNLVDEIEEKGTSFLIKDYEARIIPYGTENFKIKVRKKFFYPTHERFIVATSFYLDKALGILMYYLGIGLKKHSSLESKILILRKNFDKRARYVEWDWMIAIELLSKMLKHGSIVSKQDLISKSWKLYLSTLVNSKIARLPNFIYKFAFAVLGLDIKDKDLEKFLRISAKEFRYE